MKPGRTPNQEPSTGGDVYEITIPFHFRSFTAVLQKGAPSANSDSDRHIQSSKKSCSTIVQPWVNLALRSRAIFPCRSLEAIFFSSPSWSQREALTHRLGGSCKNSQVGHYWKLHHLDISEPLGVVDDKGPTEAFRGPNKSHRKRVGNSTDFHQLEFPWNLPKIQALQSELPLQATFGAIGSVGCLQNSFCC